MKKDLNPISLATNGGGSGCIGGGSGDMSREGFGLGGARVDLNPVSI